MNEANEMVTITVKRFSAMLLNMERLERDNEQANAKLLALVNLVIDEMKKQTERASSTEYVALKTRDVLLALGVDPDECVERMKKELEKNE